MKFEKGSRKDIKKEERVRERKKEKLGTLMRKMYMKIWMLKLSAWVWVGGWVGVCKSREIGFLNCECDSGKLCA